ncbi:hypothetical protein A0J61_03140 [Choanephora cucurbitarum]|uniref:Uncharacterized protein n=1 Tax=Choanephora cucurbitarum TaxID=101091 RepID=A0A1C7NNF5_9FUNG|nr:hypothetical protein A0J61_03140 [Choanephora cucurbitarum]
MALAFFVPEFVGNASEFGLGVEFSAVAQVVVLVFYNSSLSFASLGAKLDLSLANMRSGSDAFLIQGSPYHLIEPVILENGTTLTFTSIYIPMT